MHKFVVKVRHSKGVTNIVTSAQNAEAARRVVMAAEKCPERAIISMVAVDAQGFERVLEKPDEYVVLPIPASSVRQGIRQLQPSRRRPTMLKVRTIDSRWRRVYEGMCNNTEVRFVKHDGVKTCVLLPGD